MKDIASFVAALGDVPVVTDAEHVRRRSRDMTAQFSPVMKQDALEHTADVPGAAARQGGRAAHRLGCRTVAHAADDARRRHLQLRPGIPLAGGALVDMTALDRCCGRATAACGRRPAPGCRRSTR
ncbi:hypothetical protein HK414_21525 [Ramlibacter terrae]|uniref:FAD-binding oxidoreductase n=1 Tax=Ramlibacter terrae TaxID=2732511 RepID=A0ABX6P6G2_9BURK|nr:hypothetical protein HK414_21525 [Ramlibacter terrae]